MLSKAKVTEIYCMADDFCKEFAKVQEKYMVEDKERRYRNKPNRMSDAEIMVILILFHSGGFRCFKHYYREYICKHLTHLFPRGVFMIIYWLYYFLLIVYVAVNQKSIFY